MLYKFFLSHLLLIVIFVVGKASYSETFNDECDNFDVNYIACFNFHSGSSKKIILRNKVAVISNEIEKICDLSIRISQLEFKKILTGLSNPVTSIANGDIEINGDSVTFLQFLSVFR